MRSFHRRRAIAAGSILISICAIPFERSTRASELPSPLTLDDVIAAVRSQNLDVASGRKRVQAALERPAAAGLADDPMVMLEWWQQPVDFMTVPLMLTLKQRLPWPSKQRLQREELEVEARATGVELDGVTRQKEAEAKRAWFDLMLADASLDLSDRERTILQHVVEVTEARYRVAKAAQSDVMGAQAELLVVQNERLDLERARDDATTRLNGLLDRDADATLPKTNASVEIMELPPASTLLARAADRRPEVRRAREVLKVASVRASLARKESLPELTAWGSYMVNIRGTDTFTLGVSSTIPEFSHKREKALAGAADSEVEAARIAVRSAERQAQVEVRSALLQLETAARHTRLHVEKLVPLSDAALESALAAYEAGRVDLIAVLAAARAVRMHHLDHARFLADYGRRLADLELALGEDIADLKAHEAAGGAR